MKEFLGFSLEVALFPLREKGLDKSSPMLTNPNADSKQHEQQR
jgi:hypothetical protein